MPEDLLEATGALEENSILVPRAQYARKIATHSDRRRALCPGVWVNPWVLYPDSSQRSAPEDPENSLGSVPVTLPSLRGPSLEAPQESATIPFSLAALTIPRALLS
jgi:hypothetical protein